MFVVAVFRAAAAAATVVVVGGGVVDVAAAVVGDAQLGFVLIIIPPFGALAHFPAIPYSHYAHISALKSTHFVNDGKKKIKNMLTIHN